MRTGIALTLALSGLSHSLVAQAELDPDRVIVTATRRAQYPLFSPYSTSSLTTEELRRRSYRTLPQTLRDTPGVMVQETAHGHGSPYIRGFTSFRTLMQVDGVRLNHSAFRPGPNQYWNTVDTSSLDRIEIVKGPSSVLYGSDAIGGTVSAFTRAPYLFGDEAGFVYGGSTSVRFSDAENSLIGRAEFSLGLTHEGGSRTGFLIGGTKKHFGDLEGGAGTGDQPETGYDEDDYDLRIDHWFDDDTRLTFLHQRVIQTDVPRTHRTVFANGWRGTSVGSDQKRAFDQERSLTYLQFHDENRGGVFETVRANLSWHAHDEVRERIRGNGDQEFQGFDVGQLGAWVNAVTPTEVGTFTYGVEYYRDDVDSFLSRPGGGAADMIQGPVADDAVYAMLGVFAQDELEVSHDLRLTLGARFTHVDVDADSVRDPVTDNRISIDEDFSAVVGSARFSYQLCEDRTTLFGGVSQGFRAPNLSDLSRFDSARSNEFEIPALGLDPENYVEYELGIKTRGAASSAQLSYFFIDIDDQILRFPTGNVNGSGESEVTKANVGDGYVYGIEFGGAIDACDCIEVFGNATYLEGEVDNFTTSLTQTNDDYLTRLMPLTYQIGARWEEELGRGWAETTIVRAEDADKLSFGDTSDSSRVPPGGTPSYTVWNIRGGVHVSENTELVVLLENITDVDYRVHGSGQNRPGRNFVVSVTTTF